MQLINAPGSSSIDFYNNELDKYFLVLTIYLRIQYSLFKI
jgi:hypothetical protein